MDIVNEELNLEILESRLEMESASAIAASSAPIECTCPKHR